MPVEDYIRTHTYIHWNSDYFANQDFVMLELLHICEDLS